MSKSLNLMISSPKKGRLVATVKGEVVGRLYLLDDGEVEWIETQEEYQRRGVATALWDHAVRVGLNPRHSPCRYDEGTAWAVSVGGDLPENHTLPCSRCSTWG